MKYPYIGKGTESGSIVLFYEQGQGVTLDSKSWPSGKLQHSNFNEDLFTNITREYLANTYGEVKSKEHSEFIVKLAEENKIELGIDGYSEKRNYFYFTEDEDLLYLVFSSFSPSSKHTSITIPLPPKEPEEDSMKQPERKLLASILTLEQLGYTYHGGELWKPPIAEAVKEHEPKEWPQVGEEVSFPSGKGILVVDKPDINGIIIVKSTDEYSIDEYKKVSLNALKKPLTPEEELREKLKDELSSYISRHDPYDTLIDLTYAILNGEIEGLSYKPE